MLPHEVRVFVPEKQLDNSLLACLTLSKIRQSKLL